MSRLTKWLGLPAQGSIGDALSAQLPRVLRFPFDLTRHCALELIHDRALEMAAALTYRTIFSLIPTFVLALVVFNAFGGFEGKGALVQDWIFKQTGISNLSLKQTASDPADDWDWDWDWDEPAPTTPAPGVAPGAAPGDRAHEEKIEARYVNRIITRLTTQAQNVSLGSVGIVGMVLLIWAALALVISVEQAFNRVYDCPTGRPWHLRITIYWAVITLGPVLLFASLYLTGQAVALVRELGAVGALLAQLSRFTALLMSWLLLFLLYMLMPNTRVRWRSAAVGAFVTAILYEAGKWGFQLYVNTAVGYSRLYGTLGLIPLFLFWIYVTWLIVLFGLELTYTLQAMKAGRLKHLAARQATLSADPQWLIPIMVRIGQAFARGGAINSTDLAHELGAPERMVVELARRLEEAGLIHRAQAGRNVESGYALSLPPDRIPIGKLVDLARAMMPGRASAAAGAAGTPGAGSVPALPGQALLERLAQAQHAEVRDLTLADAL